MEKAFCAQQLILHPLNLLNIQRNAAFHTKNIAGVHDHLLTALQFIFNVLAIHFNKENTVSENADISLPIVPFFRTKKSHLVYKVGVRFVCQFQNDSPSNTAYCT